jgi:signal transduction histidine kinase
MPTATLDVPPLIGRLAVAVSSRLDHALAVSRLARVPFVVGALSIAILLFAGGLEATRGGVALAISLGLAVELGLVWDRDRRRRKQAEVIIDLMRRVRLETGLEGTIEALATGLLTVLDASRVLIAAEEKASGRAFLWSAERRASGTESDFEQSVLGVVDRNAYFFEAPATWQAARRRHIGHGKLHAKAVDPRSGRVRGVSANFIPTCFRMAYDRDAYVAASFAFGDEWGCRLFVLDGAGQMTAVDQLHLVRDLVDEIGPAVHNLFLLHRLQTRAAEIERANLARGLHDGLIQSLIGAEMRVHVARRHAGEELPRVDAELSHIEEILHQEVLNVRDLMQRIKPIRIEPGELLEFLGDELDRFERDTGISTRFFPDAGTISISAFTCAQIARIVQEALCNVRKHSGARSVDVRFIAEQEGWSLVVEDDGRGLRGSGPTGVLPEPGSQSRTFRLPSPAVIRECVRSIGGGLKVTVGSSGGFRLEITIPGPSNARPSPLDQWRTAMADVPMVPAKVKPARVAALKSSAGRASARGATPFSR